MIFTVPCSILIGERWVFFPVYPLGLKLIEKIIRAEIIPSTNNVRAKIYAGLRLFELRVSEI